MMLKAMLLLVVGGAALAGPQRSTVEVFKSVSHPQSHIDAHAEAKEAFRNSDTFSALDAAGAQFFQMLGNFASSISRAVSDSMERARQTTTSRASFSSSSLPAPAPAAGSSGDSGFTVVKSFNKKVIPHSSHH
ncbi:uncharacterized protein LOC119587917 [Penaeus monodon]|uniref:uncharacterized protein LOC119587917 n=1 Tax=Penaeus monodon TaxID=6687 RepID=UPI0018A74D5E|nr:uncharacterized protein LOC119587917 [Penaeus monodon]